VPGAAVAHLSTENCALKSERYAIEEWAQEFLIGQAIYSRHWLKFGLGQKDLNPIKINDF
jgi:hypothetical protein